MGAFRILGDNPIPFVGFGGIVNIGLRVCRKISEPELSLGDWVCTRSVRLHYDEFDEPRRLDCNRDSQTLDT